MINLKKKRHVKISLKIFFIILGSLLVSVAVFMFIVLAGYYTPLLKILDKPSKEFNIDEHYINENKFPQKEILIHTDHSYGCFMIMPFHDPVSNEKCLSSGYVYDEVGNIVIKSQWQYLYHWKEIFDICPSKIAYYAIYTEYDWNKGVEYRIEITDRNKYPRKAVLKRLEEESNSDSYPFPYIFQYCFSGYDELCDIMDYYHYDYIVKDTDKELNLLSNIDAAKLRINKDYSKSFEELENLSLEHTYSDPIQSLLKRKINFEAIDVPVYSSDHDTRYISYAYRGDYSKLYWIGIVFSIFSFLIAFFILMQRMISYVKTIENGIVCASEGNLDYKIPVKGSDELAHLAYNINQMTNSLKRHIKDEKLLIESRANLITNLSHDLLTPITTIMGYITLLQEEKWETKEDQKRYLGAAMNKADDLKCLIQKALNYSLLLKTHRNIHLTEANIDHVFAEMCLQLKALATQDEFDLLIEKPTSKAKIICNKNFLDRVVGNIMMNSVRYGDSSRPIQLSVDEKSKFIEIVIANGIKCDEYSIHLNFKSKKQRYINERGTGLGLPICEQLMSLQKGYIKTNLYRNSKNKCMFSVTLGFLKIPASRPNPNK